MNIFKRILHFLNGHKFKAIKVHHYDDTLFGTEIPCTIATVKCTECGKIDTKILYNCGYLTLEEIND